MMLEPKIFFMRHYNQKERENKNSRSNQRRRNENRYTTDYENASLGDYRTEPYPTYFNQPTEGYNSGEDVRRRGLHNDDLNRPSYGSKSGGRGYFNRERHSHSGDQRPSSGWGFEHNRRGVNDRGGFMESAGQRGYGSDFEFGRHHDGHQGEGFPESMEFSSRVGQHRGKGPKGYQRSDERIRENISDMLSDDDQLDASEIEVKVENGEVILSGFTSDKYDKRRAEDIAEDVSGVKYVENRIRVGKSTDQDSQSNGSSLKREATKGAERDWVNR